MCQMWYFVALTIILNQFNRNNFPLVLKSAGENVHEQHLALIQWLFVFSFYSPNTSWERKHVKTLSMFIWIISAQTFQLHSLISDVKAWHVGGHPCRERVQAQTSSYQNRSITLDGGDSKPQRRSPLCGKILYGLSTPPSVSWYFNWNGNERHG